MANPPIDSYNGNGLTLATYLDGILKWNNEINGVAASPHKNFWEPADPDARRKRAIDSFRNTAGRIRECRQQRAGAANPGAAPKL